MGVWTVPKAWQWTGVTSGASGDRGFCRAKELGVGTGGNGLRREGADKSRHSSWVLPQNLNPPAVSSFERKPTAISSQLYF